MATKALNFIQMFQYTYQDSQGTAHVLERIVIPMIQRDYAQGREDARTCEVRKRFLDALHEAVMGKPITLDFIYGDISPDGIMTPLDGQQRLTTLFLLHWYAAKKAEVPEGELAFLKHFSYETRASARMFCEKLVDFVPDKNLGKPISEDIIDQSWFPLSWKKDATVASMLVMLDAIQKRFADVPNLWAKLQGDAITFYFLPIREMGLTDELYIKMNSRGKPLTDFEHFKAELERRLRQIDKETAQRIIYKIDTVWTDLLWPYRGENNIIDDEFLRYFRFLCDILCYQEGDTPRGKPNGSFDLLARYFDPAQEMSKAHADMLERCFDAWCALKEEGGPSAFVKKFLSEEHQPDKVKFWDDKTDLFLECLAAYGEMRDARNRLFPLNKTVLFYAFHVYLLHRDKITTEAFTDRLSIVVHLCSNSQDEISDSESRTGGNRMPAILQQVDSIIGRGEILQSGLDPNFNAAQLQEEAEKQAWTAEHPEDAEALHALEDHPLLYGQMGIIGLEQPELFPRFAELFACDWDAVDCALVATGDYRQQDRNNWRYQLGSSGANGGGGRRISVAWQKLFHRTKGNEGSFEHTGKVLRTLLSRVEPLTDEALHEVADRCLRDCTAEQRYDWRYYYIRYPSFRRGRYGTYEWADAGKPYECFAFWSESYASSRMCQPFLFAIDPKNEEAKDEYNRVLRYGKYAIACENDSFSIYECVNIKDVREKGLVPVERLPIPQEQGIDTVDRIEQGKKWLSEMRKGLGF
ncbi:MAG: DUF262 domain-containing protein [Veillonellaceae bacterium]|nr:DUF262 domain-containing protein [Veillonellaceae bacterium]